MRITRVVALIVASAVWSFSQADKPVAQFEVPSPLTTTALCTDGAGMVGAAKDGAVYAWDRKTGKQAHRVDVGRQRVSSLSCSQKYIAVGFADGAIALANRSTSKITKRLKIGKTELKELRIAPDSSFLAVAPTLAPAELWNVETGTRIAVLGNEFGAAWAIAISPDSQRVATGDEDTNVRIYDRRGKLVSRNADLPIEMFAVGFFSSREVAVAGADGSIRVLDAETGKTLRATKGDSDVVFDLAASPDGRTVCALYLDSFTLKPTKLQVWDMQSATLLKTIEPKGILGGGTAGEELLLIRADGEKSASLIAVR